MKLPPQHDHTQKSVDLSEGKCLLIIGANGAGKSRFTNWLINNMRGSSVRVSALEALYDTRNQETLPGSIDDFYAHEIAHTPILASLEGSKPTTRFERLMSILLREEVLSLISYKMLVAEDPKTPLASTPLDKLIKIWRQIFPENKILIKDGRLLFMTPQGDDAYSSVRLSDGEKAILYYVGAVVISPANATIFVDNPTALLHPSIASLVWSRLEILRKDCVFCYTTHDLEFAGSLTGNKTVWVKEYNPDEGTWDYDILPDTTALPDDIYLAIIGSRKPVLFIEGDDIHSIDAKLYPYIFPGYNVKALGSCNKVIESVRSFNDLNGFHHLDSYGIVDRDRRDEGEVEYLNGKKILVPGVAEVENILMLEDVIKAVAASKKKDPEVIFNKVRRHIVDAFRQELHQQALLHTRHRVKRTLEYRVDGRFRNIAGLEEHMHSLVDALDPRGLYEKFCQQFRSYVNSNDYHAILRVFNRKSMISFSNIASMCGINGGKDGYIKAIINLLQASGEPATKIRRAVRECFGLDPNTDKMIFKDGTHLGTPPNKNGNVCDSVYGNPTPQTTSAQCPKTTSSTSTSSTSTSSTSTSSTSTSSTSTSSTSTSSSKPTAKSSNVYPDASLEYNPEIDAEHDAEELRALEDGEYEMAEESDIELGFSDHDGEGVIGDVDINTEEELENFVSEGHEFEPEHKSKAKQTPTAKHKKAVHSQEEENLPSWDEGDVKSSKVPSVEDQSKVSVSSEPVPTERHRKQKIQVPTDFGGAYTPYNPNKPNQDYGSASTQQSSGKKKKGKGFQGGAAHQQKAKGVQNQLLQLDPYHGITEIIHTPGSKRKKQELQLEEEEFFAGRPRVNNGWIDATGYQGQSSRRNGRVGKKNLNRWWEDSSQSQKPQHQKSKNQKSQNTATKNQNPTPSAKNNPRKGPSLRNIPK